jgi:hypothetical protein
MGVHLNNRLSTSNSLISFSIPSSISGLYFAGIGASKGLLQAQLSKEVLIFSSFHHGLIYVSDKTRLGGKS